MNGRPATYPPEKAVIFHLRREGVASGENPSGERLTFSPRLAEIAGMRVPAGRRPEELLSGLPPQVTAVVPASHGATARRKGTAIRAWVVVPESGGSRLEELGKHTIMRRTGLPARDLRVLDPALSYPSSILGRERAIVVNLEHVKAIITATEVLIPKSNQPLLGTFIQDLQSRISVPAYGAPEQGTSSFDMDGDLSKPTCAWPQSDVADGLEDPGFSVHQQHDGATPDYLSSPHLPDDGPGATIDTVKGSTAKTLPFEFRALEVCLESACRCLESETIALEQEAYPALDELTSKISSLNLERVRLIKNRLVTISGRVQKGAGEASARVADLENEGSDGDDEGDEQSDDDLASNSGILTTYKPDIEELEMLLEAYFVQIDATLNKLSALREYVDDTEDYINIMLDDKQNQLLEMGVMLSTATLVFSAGIVVVSIFGMNIGISLYDETTPHNKFFGTAVGTIGGCAILYVIAIGWGKKRGLLQ